MPSRTLARAVLALFLLLPAALPAAATQTDEYVEVIRTIRCDCSCHPQSVESCACGRAAEMRETIAGLVEGVDDQEPLSADAVIALYVAEQGQQIRIAPAATGFNLVAWLGPLIGLVLGLFAAVALVRHLARGAGTRGPEGLVETGSLETVPVVDPDDPYRAKLRRQLQEWD